MNRIRSIWFGALLVLLAVGFLASAPSGSRAQAAPKPYTEGYRVLEPLESGALTLFPIVRNEIAGPAAKWQYITLDEGLRSGDVVVTEAGRVGGMVRPHRGRVRPVQSYRGDEVNTLVLVNNSDRPLILLAGEIVTGGKQDRVIAKDRVVPAQSDPIDLSVFCIEPGRWTESSGSFDTVSREKSGSFMVQPKVRSQAMVAENQQQVWDSVHKTIASAQVGTLRAEGLPLPPMNTETVTVTAEASTVATTSAMIEVTGGTSSYAKAMKSDRIAKQVDKAAGPLIRSREEILKKLREEHAVGVVVAIHGEIVWADIFATPEMLASYWTKLVRSYAAESFDNIRVGAKKATVADAQEFLDRPVKGTETSVGESGIYSYREVRGEKQSAFYLKVFASGGDFYAHISRVAEDGTKAKAIPAME
jgi:hypothetical protein